MHAMYLISSVFIVFFSKKYSANYTLFSVLTSEVVVVEFLLQCSEMQLLKWTCRVARKIGTIFVRLNFTKY